MDMAEDDQVGIGKGPGQRPLIALEAVAFQDGCHLVR